MYCLYFWKRVFLRNFIQINCGAVHLWVKTALYFDMSNHVQWNNNSVGGYAEVLGSHTVDPQSSASWWQLIPGGVEQNLTIHWNQFSSDVQTKRGGESAVWSWCRCIVIAAVYGARYFIAVVTKEAHFQIRLKGAVWISGFWSVKTSDILKGREWDVNERGLHALRNNKKKKKALNMFFSWITNEGLSFLFLKWKTSCAERKL